MALYGVEHDLNQVSVERYRQAQDLLIAECATLRRHGRRIRFISSVLDPAAARGVCLFGSESRELVEWVTDAGGLPSARIFQLLDLTPGDVHRAMSRARRARSGPARPTAGAGPTAGDVAPLREDLGCWIAEGQRLVTECLDTARSKAQLERRAETLEQDNERLRADVDRLEETMQVVIAEREELLATFLALAGRVDESVGQISRRLRTPA
jgi:hypothetical protein